MVSSCLQTCRTASMIIWLATAHCVRFQGVIW